MLNGIGQRKVFWLLKRASSLTYWQHIRETQQTFLYAVESVVKHHSENDPSPGRIDLYKRSLDDVINLESGIQGLSMGDRSGFRQHVDGHFTQSGEGYGYLLDLLRLNDAMEDPDGYITDGENLKRLAETAMNARFWGRGILEPQRSDEPAAWYPSWILLPENLPEYAFPEPLPPVPEAPMPPVIIQTGGELPVDGIYEPEGEGTCMNYLLGGAIAPTVMREYGELHESIFHKGKFIRSIETIPTTWRLIWADHRYEDGTVPEEEKDYFLPKPKGAVAAPPEATGRALPGGRCPRAGFWYTHAKEGSRRRFEEGEDFPDFPDSAWGATIWYWDTGQDG